ncbi:hypothetical protein DO71_4587 [Burkholderia pseudomallei]|nr:hypothetical protein DO71_4587 [Burkholderia pseudomallei]
MALVTLAESKGFPTNELNEHVLALSVIHERWNEIPIGLARLIRDDDEIKAAFHAFDSASRGCDQRPLPKNWIGRRNARAGIRVADLYMRSFMRAASEHNRKLYLLESALTQLETLPVDKLHDLISAGDDLSKRIAVLSLRVADELKRRNAQKGANARSKRLEPVREHALLLANEKPYPSRRQAVLAIKDRVLTYANSIDGVSMSPDQAFDTIDGWLKKSGYTPSAGKQGMPTG